MADRGRLRDRLGTRLAAAFAATAAAAVLIVTVLALVATGSSVADLVAEQRRSILADVVDTLAVAYEEANGWAGADLLPAHTLAASAGAVLEIETLEGDVLPPPEGAETIRRRIGPDEGTDQAPTGPTPTESDGEAPGPGPTRDEEPSPARPQERNRTPAPTGPGSSPHSGAGTSGAGVRQGVPLAMAASLTVAAEPEIEARLEAPIVVDGQTVGSARLLFVTPTTGSAEQSLQRSLSRLLLGAGGLALLFALVAAGFVTPRLTRPLRRLTERVAAIAAGTRSPATGDAPQVAELRQLASAVDAMAADLDRQERLRRALIADVGHEVRTPLTVLAGEVEGMLDGVIEPTPEALRSLQEEVQRLARLIEDLDALAEAEHAGFAMQRSRVDLGRLVRGGVEPLRSLFDANGLTLDLETAPVEVVADWRRMEQVARNLVSNAIKFSPAGGTVTVRVGADDGHALLRVVDDGPGIPDDEIPHVFERFWRGAGAAGVGGSGVGLAVVAELVRAHGGTVTAGSAPSRGACLEVRLPRAGPAPAGN